MTPEDRADAIEWLRERLPRMSRSARMAFLLDLHAPIGEDGERHPELGFITATQLRELLDCPSDT